MFVMSIISALLYVIMIVIATIEKEKISVYVVMTLLVIPTFYYVIDFLV